MEALWRSWFSHKQVYHRIHVEVKFTSCLTEYQFLIPDEFGSALEELIFYSAVAKQNKFPAVLAAWEPKTSPAPPKAATGEF